MYTTTTADVSEITNVFLYHQLYMCCCSFVLPIIHPYSTVSSVSMFISSLHSLLLLVLTLEGVIEGAGENILFLKS